MRLGKVALLVRVIVACAAFFPASGLAQNFLWQVTSLTNRAYLFGTIHAGRAEWYPLPAAVEDALADSDALVVEADITAESAIAKTGAATTYTPPDSLRNHVAKEDYERLLHLLPNYPVPAETIVKMKPFMAVSFLVFAEWARLGYLPQMSVDGYLIRRARAESKPVVELEGVEAQVKLIDSLSDAESATLFASTLGAIESGLVDRQIAGTVRAWQVGDPQAMLEVARRYDEQVKGAAALEEKFVWSRNAAMVQKIAGWLDAPRDRRFIAVGALHLVGPRGIVELLRKRGYVVRQVFVAPQGEPKHE
jgi:uncharacterized protein YbaP (TraB family)